MPISRSRLWLVYLLPLAVLVAVAAMLRGALAPASSLRPPQAESSQADARPAREATGARPLEAGAATGATSSAPPDTLVAVGGSKAPGQSSAAEPWRALTQFDFARLPVADMPPDDGNVSPVAADDQAPDGESTKELDRLAKRLTTWAPGHVADPVQRVRNYLLLVGVADFAQSTLERFLPQIVLTHMLTEFPPNDLAQLLCWVALHPDEGDVTALADPLLVEFGAPRLDADEVRTRTYYYGVKLTRRLIGW